jgi:hypothetical protein
LAKTNSVQTIVTLGKAMGNNLEGDAFIYGKLVDGQLMLYLAPGLGSGGKIPTGITIDRTKALSMLKKLTRMIT